MKYAADDLAKSVPGARSASGGGGQGTHPAAAGRAHVYKTPPRV